MSLDTKYRPIQFEDVLGQEATVQVLREIVRQGKGRHQSYVFAGAHGAGKTTLARILARALLCEDPQEGDPCGKCSSCLSILTKGSCEGFVELDAATRSGKDDVLRIVEDATYATTRGVGKVYLFDESHRLSKSALDALLKPMEDTVTGTSEKRLVCIFCTTEPDKMSSTIFSRCAPTFTIRSCSPELIAERLAFVCEQEGIEYEQEALVTIAEIHKSHIRPCLKSLESMGSVGPITQKAVHASLSLDNISRYLKILAYMGADLQKATAMVEELRASASPATVYSQLAEACMMAYKAHLGIITPPSYWHPQFLKKLGSLHGERLLGFAHQFAQRPQKATLDMVILDVARLHHASKGTVIFSTPQTAIPLPNASATPAQNTPEPPKDTSVSGSAPDNGRIAMNPEAGDSPISVSNGVYVDVRAIRRTAPKAQKSVSGQMCASEARSMLSGILSEIEDASGSKGRPKLGRIGTDEDR